MRQANLNRLIQQTLACIRVPSVLELTSLYGTETKRPGGLTVVPLKHGKQLLWDVTAVDALSPSRLSDGFVGNTGTAAVDGEERKCDKNRCLFDKG